MRAGQLCARAKKKGNDSQIPYRPSKAMVRQAGQCCAKHCIRDDLRNARVEDSDRQESCYGSHVCPCLVFALVGNFYISSCRGRKCPERVGVILRRDGSGVRRSGPAEGCRPLMAISQPLPLWESFQALSASHGASEK